MHIRTYIYINNTFIVYIMCIYIYTVSIYIYIIIYIYIHMWSCGIQVIQISGPFLSRFSQVVL